MAASCGTRRYCEVVLRVLALANPQWTPLRGEAPDWMRVGFAIFEALPAYPRVYEVFPSASYSSSLHDARAVRLNIDLAAFAVRPKDMLDACVAAVAAREYVAGRGCAVGGGDGRGEIILPCPVEPHPVLKWP